MTPRRSPVSEALRAFIQTYTGRPTGYGHLPVTATGDEEDLPVCVLEPLPSALAGAAFGDRFADGWWSYQVKVIGGRLDSAEAVMDDLDAALFGRNATGWVVPLNIPGQREWNRHRDPSGFQSGATADGIVTLILRFQITTSPTP